MAKQDKDKTQSATDNECFIIMPFSDPEGYERGHFRKVYEDIFVPACKFAGYKATRGDDKSDSNLIQVDILQRLLETPMAICDLSTRNPNVLFELGLRQAFDMPTILVQEEDTKSIFDISSFRYHEYKRTLAYRDVVNAQQSITKALIETKEALESGRSITSLVRLLALTNPAKISGISTKDAVELDMLHVIRDDISELRGLIKGTSKIEEDWSLDIIKKPSQSLTKEDVSSTIVNARRFILSLNNGKKYRPSDYMKILGNLSIAEVSPHTEFANDLSNLKFEIWNAFNDRITAAKSKSSQ